MNIISFFLLLCCLYPCILELNIVTNNCLKCFKMFSKTHYVVIILIYCDHLKKKKKNCIFLKQGWHKGPCGVQCTSVIKYPFILLFFLHFMYYNHCWVSLAYSTHYIKGIKFQFEHHFLKETFIFMRYTSGSEERTYFLIVSKINLLDCILLYLLIQRNN